MEPVLIMWYYITTKYYLLHGLQLVGYRAQITTDDVE